MGGHLPPARVFAFGEGNGYEQIYRSYGADRISARPMQPESIKTDTIRFKQPAFLAL
jgi:hypothetical protein